MPSNVQAPRYLCRSYPQGISEYFRFFAYAQEPRPRKVGYSVLIDGEGFSSPEYQMSGLLSDY